MDLILWSFALQLWVLIWVDFIKTHLFGKPELHQEAAGVSRGINKTILSKQSTVKACCNFLYWEGQDVPLVRPSSCIVKGSIPSSRRYLPTYLPLVCKSFVILSFASCCNIQFGSCNFSSY